MIKQLIVIFGVFSSSVWAAEDAPRDKQVSEQKLNPIEKFDREDDIALQRHLPFYFLYSAHLSKLQISFKTPVIRKIPFYFAYTQVMFWALHERSKPFRDLAYNPEIFYRWKTKNWGILESIDFGAFGHSSNGKKERDSRSYDKQYIRFNLSREGRRWVTRLSAGVAYLYDLDSTNRDIQEYVGPVSVSLSFIQMFDAYIDKSEISLKAAPGGKFANQWDQGGYQISWAFRMGKIAVVPAFYVQYYHGYAETLLNYDKHVDEFRGGLLF